MKNLKTKVGVSLAALAFFATIGLTSGSTFGLHSGLPPAEEENRSKKDPNVMKVVETLKKVKYVNGYGISDKTIIFYFKDRTILSNDPSEFLGSQIYKANDKKGAVCKKLIIKDYDFDNLNDKDEIIYFKTVTRNYIDYEWAEDIPETIKFSEFSSKAQQEIRKEYDKIIKEAPEKMLKADKNYKRSLEQQEERRKHELEDYVLSIIK